MSETPWPTSAPEPASAPSAPGTSEQDLSAGYSQPQAEPLPSYDQGYQQTAAAQGQYGQGQYQSGSYAQGTYQQAAYQQSQYDQPASPQGAYQQGAYQQSQYEQPAAAQSAYQQQGYQQQGYQQGAYQAAPMYASQKSRVAAGLLAIFLGFLGIHNFYLGHNGRAVTQLLISVLTFGVGTAVVAIWALVEGILILTSQPGSHPWGVDAQGVPLSA